MSVVSVVAGVLLVSWALVSAVRTVVIPRPEKVWISRSVQASIHWIGETSTRFVRSERWSDQIRGVYGPLTLITLPIVWSVLVVVGFALIFLGLGVSGAAEAIALSASSLTTLGFVGSDQLNLRLIAAVEALIGLGIVALMISFLPTIYSAFARREAVLSHLTVRAGDPPHPVVFALRAHAIGELNPTTDQSRLGERWAVWEAWFVDLKESHTTFPALVFFRSADPDRSWVRAAESALDTAAILRALGVGATGGQQDTMIRAGYLALHSIADFFDLHEEVDSDAPISVDRHMFDQVIEHLEASGIGSERDHEQVWHDYRGWRVNYDQSIGVLAELTKAPTSHWSRSNQWKPEA